MSLAGYADYMGEITEVYWIAAEKKNEVTAQLGRRTCSWRMILKWIIQYFEWIKVARIPGFSGRYLKKMKISNFLTALSTLKLPITFDIIHPLEYFF